MSRAFFISCALVVGFGTLPVGAQATNGECGLTQTNVDARIHDCSALPDSTRKANYSWAKEWRLVARKHDEIGKFYEVWQDTATGLLWGDRLDKWYAHDDQFASSTLGLTGAIDVDVKTGKILRETACLSNDGRRANVEIGEVNFGLPTPDEFSQAQVDGFAAVLPQINGDNFWTAKFDQYYQVYPQVAFMWDPIYATGPGQEMYRGDSFSVRCVGR